MAVSKKRSVRADDTRRTRDAKRRVSVRTAIAERPGAGRRRAHRVAWGALKSEELLDLRFSDLGLKLAGTTLEDRVDELHEELARAGLRFRPYVWFSTDWFTPDGFTGFAAPFYLAHPRLVRLEREQMFVVEGGTHDECMRLLRHEAGHALDNAFRLRRSRRFREVFGPVSRPYRMSYAPDPTSRGHVVNLGQWYAQSHPVEDFAETFAVWLRGGRWRSRYASHAALRKLAFVDELMQELRGRQPLVRSRGFDEPIGEQRMTLRRHYGLKRARYDLDLPSEHDPALKRVFSPRTTGLRPTASGFLRRYRASLLRRVETTTGLPRYLIEQILNELLPRCRQLDLRLDRSEFQTLLDTTDLVARLARRYAYATTPTCSR